MPTIRLFSLALTLALTLVFPSEAANKASPIGGVDHIGLTVTKLDKSKDFFVQTLGFKELGKDPSYPAYFLNNGAITITLWQAKTPVTEFNRKNNVGLHHLAFQVETEERLHALHKLLQEAQGVTIEFASEHLGKGPTKHMMIREPSGNRLEFIHRAKS